MIFKTVNLDGLTCIQKIEVLLQEAIMTKEKSKKSLNLNLNPFKRGGYCSNTVETLQSY
jgi:hypothetical protein